MIFWALMIIFAIAMPGRTCSQGFFWIEGFRMDRAHAGDSRKLNPFPLSPVSSNNIFRSTSSSCRSNQRRISRMPHPIFKSKSQHQIQVILQSAPDGMQWFVKTEQFCKPYPEVKTHLEAHRAWVRSLRGDKSNTQQIIVSGYRVDANDKPGGGGLMIFAAKNYAAAEKLVLQDPVILNECVDWQLNRWLPETGDISIE